VDNQHVHRWTPRDAFVVVAGVFVLVVVGYLVWLSSASSQAAADSYVAVLPSGASTVPDVAEPQSVPLAQAAPMIDSINPAWVNTTAAKAGIPPVALRAYAAAQLSAPPACHLNWATLAGIGWIESVHGSHGGSVLTADGETTGAIKGPQLDGGLGKAMGPMQFIADTWNRWASDGDGNGTADINNINDAAYTAARYLCSGGRDLSKGSDWASAVFSYNHAQWYVDEVYGAATTYAKRAG
jgi:hypothetical protein